MAGSSWKVAYADFMTAMMAFFLVMWLLNMAPKETLVQLSGYFDRDGKKSSMNISPYGMSNNNMVQYVDKLDTREYKMDESEQSQYAIVQSIKQILRKDSIPESSSGIASDNLGVLLHITPNLLFKPNTVEFSEKGEKILNEVIKVMHKYKVYLVVRGHADSSETGAPVYPSKWELSSARANAAIRYLQENGINPALMRSVAYGDTRPRVPPTVADAQAQNSSVEFFFHRPEVMSSIVGF